MPQNNLNNLLAISSAVSLYYHELSFQAIRAQGSGGQHVNKVSSAIHLRFNIHTSSLPPFYKERLLLLKDDRITKNGIIVIKSQQYRSQELNKEAAIRRLVLLIKSAVKTPKKRKPTKPSRSSQRKRMDKKTKRGKTKALRKKVDY